MLLDAAELSIGRDAAMDIRLDDGQVSRRHALLSSGPDGVRLTDVGSVNGTFLGTTRLAANQPVLLEEGAVIRIGQSILRFSRETSASQSKPAVQPEAAVSKTSGGAGEGKEGTRPRKAVFQPAASEEKPPIFFEEFKPAPENVNGAQTQRSRYLEYLPALYSQDAFMGRFLMVFEDVLTPIERTIDNLAGYLDPQLAPADFLPWLASWIGLVLDEHWPEAQRRELIRSAVSLFEWRGTKRGLSEFIRLYTGFTPEIIEPGVGQKTIDPKQAHHFIVCITAAEADKVDRSVLETIIEAEKPAHAAYRIEIVQKDK